MWLYLESRGFHPSMRSIGRALRDQGLVFDDHALRAWLAPFYRSGTAEPPHETSTITAEPPQAHRSIARAAKVSLVSNLVGSLRSPTCVENSSHVEKAKTGKNGRPLKLPFDQPALDARNAILRLVWQHVQPVIGRSTTWSSWRARNARVADDLARGGFTPEQIEKAWEFATRDLHEPVRELSQVRRFMERVETQVAARKGGARR